MKLPQLHAYEAEGRKPTHDFLSLYSQSTFRQDPRPPSQDVYLKTHDFLQPLERAKSAAKEENNAQVSTSEKQPQPQPHPPAPPPPMEHNLPGGIGTYTISHLSYLNQRVPKPEGITTLPAVLQGSSNERMDDNSNCSSYSGNGFTLWEESSLKNGKTRNENSGNRAILREAAVKVGQWATSERPSKSSTSNQRNIFSTISSSHASEQKSQSFMNMIKSTSTQDDELDDGEEFFLKKETSSTYKEEPMVKVDEKSTGDQKPNTPRSKHSATEQRRRSKINDRFQTLRELIPYSDQKRDKASFLLEVIDYIQFLQEKVNKYDRTYEGWNHEATKVVPWKNNRRLAESYADQSRGTNNGSGPTSLLHAGRLDDKNITISPSLPVTVQNPVELDMSTSTILKAMDQRPGMINKPSSYPVSLQPNYFSPIQSVGEVPNFPSRLSSNGANPESQPQTQSCHSRSFTTNVGVSNDDLKQQELTIERGTISISSAYSQMLLTTLNQALQTSGVDLSQSSISVQIELGKTTTIPTSTDKDNDIPSVKTRCRVASSVEESDKAMKKLKTSKRIN